MTMAVRKERTGIEYPETQEALLTFKQGLGRLIRRDGVESRQLWIMDGRLWVDGGFKFHDLAPSCLRLLASYRNRKTFRI